MAIANKFLYFSTKAAYDAAVGAQGGSLISSGSIVFVDQPYVAASGDDPAIPAERFIETHGKKYYANQAADSIKAAIEALDVTDLTNSDATDRGVTITLNEVDGKVTSITISDLAGAKLGTYTKGSSDSAIASGDTIAAALSKLENQIDSVASDLSDEATARANADTAIENKIGGSYTSSNTVADAIAAVDGKVDQEALDRAAAINALDFTDTPVVKKVVTGVDEADGVISVTRKELKSTDKTVTITQAATTDDIDFAVNIDGTTILKDANTGVLSVASSALVQYVGDGKTISVGAESNGEKTISSTIKVAEVTTGLASNVEKAWDLVDANGDAITGSSRIIVKKDQAFVNGKLGHVDDTINSSTGAITDGTGADAIDLIYKNANGEYILIAIDVAQYLKESEFKDGLSVSSHEISVKLSSNTESAKYLKIQTITGENGAIELSGIDAAIAAASSSIAAKTTGHVTVSSASDANGTVYTISENDIASANDLSGEITRAGNAETAIDAVVGLTKAANSETRTYTNTGTYIGQESTNNTIASDIAALDVAAAAIAADAAEAKTVVNAKTPGTNEHITVTVTQDSTDGHDIVTVSESDIASAALVGTLPSSGTSATTVVGYAEEVANAAETAAKGYADDITVNGQSQVSQDITIGGANIELTGYTAKSGAGNGDVAATDTVNSAIKKVETKVDNLDSASPFEYASSHESTKSTVLKGEHLTAQNEGEVAVGKYNHSYTDSNNASGRTTFSVGNGNAGDGNTAVLTNAFEVRENGDIYINVKLGNAGEGNKNTLASAYSLLQTLLENEINWYEG